MGKIIVTSAKVDEETWKELKIQAIKKGVTVQELLDEAIREKLARLSK